jgi:hypothetical protein
LVETLDDVKVSIYPNPTKDHIYIKFDETITADFSISILDVLGKSYFLIENKGANIDKEQFIDLTSIQRGLYFLIIKCENFIKTYKIIKE